MRHLKKIEDKKEGLIEQQEREDRQQRSLGREVQQRTHQYYQKVRKSIVNSIVPPLVTGDKKDKEERDDYVNPSFHPEINPKSKKMKRGGSVETILYADAQKRNVKLSEKREKSE